MAKGMNPVVHFEMPAEDRARVIRFYAEAFGWKSEQLGPEMGEYVLVDTGESDQWHRPTEPGRINGGFYQKTGDMPAQYPSVVIAVEDIRGAMDDVARAGGEVLGEPMEITGVGSYVLFLDSEGNRVGMMEFLPMKE